MNFTLLWLLQLAFSLVVLATALAWTAGASRGVRGAAVGAALLPALAVGYFAWSALELRFGWDVPHAP